MRHHTYCKQTIILQKHEVEYKCLILFHQLFQNTNCSEGPRRHCRILEYFRKHLGLAIVTTDVDRLGDCQNWTNPLTGPLRDCCTSRHRDAWTSRLLSEADSRSPQLSGPGLVDSPPEILWSDQQAPVPRAPRAPAHTSSAASRGGRTTTRILGAHCPRAATLSVPLPAAPPRALPPLLVPPHVAPLPHLQLVPGSPAIPSRKPFLCLFVEQARSKAVWGPRGGAAAAPCGWSRASPDQHRFSLIPDSCGPDAPCGLRQRPNTWRAEAPGASLLSAVPSAHTPLLPAIADQPVSTSPLGTGLAFYPNSPGPMGIGGGAKLDFKAPRCLAPAPRALLQRLRINHCGLFTTRPVIPLKQ